MKFLALISIIFLHSCAGFQGAMDDMEKMVDNDAITIKVDSDALKKETDVHVVVDVVNKDQPQPQPVEVKSP